VPHRSLVNPGGRFLLQKPSPDLQEDAVKHSTAGRTLNDDGEIFVRTEAVMIVVLANLEVADKLGVAFLLSIPMFAFFGRAGGGFLGFLSPSYDASAGDSGSSSPARSSATVGEAAEADGR
jgi:hypothetical protein